MEPLTKFNLSVMRNLAACALYVTACGSSDHHPLPTSPARSCNGPRCLVSVQGSAIRSCDLVVAPIIDAGLASESALTAHFADSARGSSKQRGAELAVAFIAREDKPFSESPASIETSSDGGAVPPVTLVSATCYDRLGRPVETPDVRIRSASK
jgi:hypothetical protein